MKKFIVKELDFNDEIREVDVIELIKQQYEKYPHMRAKSRGDLAGTLRNLFWARTEHEWLIHPWVSPYCNKKVKKVDVWEWSIEPNIDIIYDICVEEGIC